MNLASGDRLVVYTDGLVEVFNSRKEMFGVAGLKTLVRQSATRALPEMKRAILDGVAAWTQGALAGDVSLVTKGVIREFRERAKAQDRGR